jgi:hypothetical protein
MTETTFQTNISVVKTEDINHQSTVFTHSVARQPESYSGCCLETLPPGTVNFEIATKVNQFLMRIKKGSPITLRVGDTTNPSQTNVSSYMYDGDVTNFYISNSGVEPVIIEYLHQKY